MALKIGIYAEHLECINYSVAYSLYLGGHKIVLITNKQRQDTQHKKYLQKILNLSNSETLDYHNTAIYLDVICIDFTRDLAKKQLLKWCKKARQTTAIFNFNGDTYWQNCSRQIKAVIKYFPLSFKYRNAVMLDSLSSIDPISFLAKTHYFGFDVHSNFLGDRALLDLMFAFKWQPDIVRKYKINFLGNIEPETRTNILKEIKQYFNLTELNTNTKKYLSRCNSYLIWHGYDSNTSNSERGCSAIEYISLLSDSDFTLCPPGYIRLTHRVVEALVRGSIPILNQRELKLYDLNLEDEVNCIAVVNNNWVKAIDKALAIKPEQLLQMRCNILQMKAKLLPEAAAEKLRAKILD